MHTERPFSLVDAVKFGAYGGVAAILISLVGMVGAFARKDIIAGVISMSQVLLIATAFAPASAAANRTLRSAAGGKALVNGAIAGAIAGLLIGLLALSIVPFNLNAVFVNARPPLVAELMPGDTEGVTGALLLVAIGAVVGLISGLLAMLPSRLRRAVLSSLGAVVLLGLIKDVVVAVIPTSFGKFLYKAGGLSVEGAVVLFVGITVIAYLWQILQPKLNRAVDRMPERRRQALRFVVTMAMLAILFVLPTILGPYLSEVADLVGFYIIMALGLNVVVGFAGLLDLGYVAFYAIGAYTMAVLTTPELPLVRSFIPQLSFWTALPIAVGVSMVAGFLLGVPVLKTRGDYLAIITLGFGEIIRLLVLSDALKPVMGGAQGVTGVARPEVGGVRVDTPQEFFYVILIGILVAWFITSRLKRSRYGRAWMAIREDEDVAAAMSIKLVGYKLAAFATGATLAGMSGAFFGSKLGSMVPASFNVLVSINVLAVLIVGGMGSLPGVVVGALALIGLPELLREFNEFRWWVYGAVLVVMMLYRPEGLWPDATRERELLEDHEPTVIDEESTGLTQDATVPT